MVVIDERDASHTWLWCDETETKAVRLPHDRTGYRVKGATDQQTSMDVIIHQEEITCSLVQGPTRGLCMPRHVAAMNGLHGF